MLNINEIIHDAIETCGFNFEDEVENAVNDTINELAATIPSSRLKNAIITAVQRREEDIDDMIQDSIEDYVQEIVDDYID